MPSPASFVSILFPFDDVPLRTDAPDCFRDLNLDQVVAGIAGQMPAYPLTALFQTPLRDLPTLRYRQAVMRDIDSAPIAASARTFLHHMQTMHTRLSLHEKLRYPHERRRWFLAGVESYCAAVEALRDGLMALDVKSDGLAQVRAHIDDYVASDRFRALLAATQDMVNQLASVRYGVLINGGHVTVRAPEGEQDVEPVVEAIFQKFRRDSAKSYLAKFDDRVGMNHVEAWILDRVAMLNPDVFSALERHCGQCTAFVDDTLARFERELPFYLAFLSYIAPSRAKGLPFCYPELSVDDKTERVEGSYDLALANKLVSEQRMPVPNDFSLSGAERTLAISGPNQGGKTTFARMVGQLHYLASLGCPVPGTTARLFVPDAIYTHFEQPENIARLRGKLEDDLFRMHGVLQRATPLSVVVLNEIFSSTSVKDAVYLGQEIMSRLSRLDALCVCVTFLDELASHDTKTVSMVSGIDLDDPAVRTFKIMRQPADGLAYAIALARKHGLTYRQMLERLPT